MRKIYKNILKAFGGAALYLDRNMLCHLGVTAGDEVIIELAEEKIIITKPALNAKKIKELLDANANLKR